MKHLTFILMLLITLVSCKDKKPETETLTKDQTEVPTEVAKKNYPETLTKIFDAHGGLDIWKTMHTLEFTIAKPDGNEITTTDLQERYAIVEMPKHTIGFDGQSVWMENKDATKYEGNPEFYYNLMFYFYAMPFVLADDGIFYTTAEPKVLEGKTYPGIKISYKQGIGSSSNDDYILYYDVDTHKMAWLAYTVTYFSKEKSKEFHYIKYSEWQDIEGLQLPKTITWYNVEDNVPTTKRNDVTFDNVVLSTDAMNFRMYMMPEDAEEIQ